MSFFALIIMFAPAVGPTLAGILLSIASWRLIFASFAVFLAIAWILAFKFIESPFELTKPKIDLLSTIINTFQQVIGAICTALTTCLLQFGQATSAESNQQAFVNGTHMSTYFVIGLAILGLILSFFVHSPQKQVEMTQEILPENN